MPRQVVYLRFPFSRNGFSDPDQSHWNREKQEELWSILSGITRRNEIDWPSLATKFNVSVPFILQQASWLYEKELQQVRDQMLKLKVGDNLSAAGGHQPGSSEYTENVNHYRHLHSPDSSTKLVRDSRGPHRSPRLSAFHRPPINSPVHSKVDDPENDLVHGSFSESESSHSSDFDSRRLLSMSRNLREPLPREDDEDDYQEAVFGPASAALPGSVSDLSETSLSKSALEEALLDYGTDGSSISGSPRHVSSSRARFN